MIAKLTLNGKLTMLQLMGLLILTLTILFGLVIFHLDFKDKEGLVQRLVLKIELLDEIANIEEAAVLEAKIAKDVWLRGNTADKIAKYRGEFVEQTRHFELYSEESVQHLQALQKWHPEFDRLLEQVAEIKRDHATVAQKYLTQIDVHRGDGAESDAKVAGIDRSLQKKLHELRTYLVAYVNHKTWQHIDAARSDISFKRIVVGVWLVLAGALSFVLARLIIRQVTAQLGGDPAEVSRLVAQVAGGDFSDQSHRQISPGSLLANVYDMQSRLRGTIGALKRQAGEVGEMAHRLATSANAIADNTNQQSGAVSNMAASIAQLSVSTTHISDQGENAKRIANSSRNNAEEGAQVVNKTVSGLLSSAQEIQGASAEVSRLGEDATHISEVVKVIKEIADQTNLLALNAAIEAARAGEQGRGFAVVADEVRKLAERTAGATTEINQMSGKIGEVAGHALGSMDKVVKTTQQGVGDAETAQVSIQHIQSSFGEVAGVIDEIAAALGEQNSAAAELAKRTVHISQLSEENAASANGLLQMANELEHKSSEIRLSVEVFKV